MRNRSLNEAELEKRFDSSLAVVLKFRQDIENGTCPNPEKFADALEHLAIDALLWSTRQSQKIKNI